MRKIFYTIVIGAFCLVGCNGPQERSYPQPKESGKITGAMETEKQFGARLQELIIKLADKKFKEREKATQSLEKMILESRDWKKIISHLKEALKKTEDPELEARLNSILKPYAKCDRWAFTPKLLSKFPDMVAKLESDDPVTRVLIAANLGGTASKDAVPVLILLLKDSDVRVRATAAHTLGEIGDTKSVEALIEMFRDKSWRVRSYTALALGMIRDKKAVEPLTAALKDENETVRHDAAWALGNIGDSRALKHLEAALKDENAGVRSGAAYALGELKDTAALKPLIETLNSEDEELRFAAAESLKKITKQDFGEDYDKWLNWWQKQK